LPKLIRVRIEGRHTFQKIIANTGWLFLDKILRMGVGFFVGVWIARYLGPEQFGSYNYALSFVALFAAIAALGLDGIVVRDIAQDPDRRDEILGTAFALRLSAGLITLLAAVTAIWMLRPGDTLMRWLVGILAAVTVFQAFDVIDFLFQAQVRSKFSIYAKNGSFLVFTVVKIGLILLEMPLIAFAWVGLAEVIGSAVGLIMVYRRTGNTFASWKIRSATARRLLHDSWPLMFAYLSYWVYMRIDQVMIGSILDDHAVGIYSVATRIFEIPLSLFLLISTSCFPVLTELYARDKAVFWIRYSQITYFYTIVAFILLACVYLFGRNAVMLAFGRSYADSYPILTIQILGLIFMANAGLRSAYLTISSNQRLIFATTVFSAVANVVMNLFLIPRFHAAGAAWANALTQMISLLILNAVFSETRGIFRIQMRALFMIPPKGMLMRTRAMISEKI
jgi:polysaccharide transporter, PST family